MTRKSDPKNSFKQHKSRPAPAKAAAAPESPHAGERIAKVVARAGLCSRREAESWVAEGRVSVNGAVISSPALNVTAADKISVDGKPLPRPERTRLFLYNKPRGLVTTHADPEKRPTIFESLPKGLPRLISIGRLDLNTEGLLLLTNDGGLARVLELPDTGWLRRYRVRANGKIMQPQLDALRKGITIDGIRYGEIEATLDREQGANVWLTFAIREGKNREVRNVLEHLGLKVNRLIRVSYGPFQLGELKDGTVEEIRTRHLREQLGERIAKESGADFEGPMTPFDATQQTATRRPPRPDRGEPRGDIALASQTRSERHQKSDPQAPLPARSSAQRPGKAGRDGQHTRRQPSASHRRPEDAAKRPSKDGGQNRRDDGRRPWGPGPAKTGKPVRKSAKTDLQLAPRGDGGKSERPRGKRRPPSRYKGKRDR
jgi:23S rRNA pseudouridine2605 synthase